MMTLYNPSHNPFPPLAAVESMMFRILQSRSPLPLSRARAIPIASSVLPSQVKTPLLLPTRIYHIGLSGFLFPDAKLTVQFIIRPDISFSSNREEEKLKKENKSDGGNGDGRESRVEGDTDTRRTYR